jgi:DNA-binding XRE family transcriptional regulator
MINVIVTTRNEDIARKVSTGEAYMLQPLKDDTCWEIIKRASKFEQKDNKATLEQVGLDIVKKCGGVALAAQAVGYMLQSKDLSEWIEISKSDIWNMSSEDDDVLPSLKLSYERMAPQLRICFSYCAIFQKGHNIVENDLIHQWIALNFIIKPSTGREYIKQLLGMSFLQVSKLPLVCISIYNCQNSASAKYLFLYNPCFAYFLILVVSTTQLLTFQ